MIFISHYSPFCVFLFAPTITKKTAQKHLLINSLCSILPSCVLTFQLGDLIVISFHDIERKKGQLREEETLNASEA